MRRESVVRASAAALAVATLLAARVVAVPELPLAIDSARVTIAGTSNIHEYTASTTEVRVTRAELGAGAAGAKFWQRALEPGAVEAFEIAIPAVSLKSPKEGLDKNMHKALKVQEHPVIAFRLARFAAGQGGAVKAFGTLNIAGVEREVALGITTESKGAGLLVKGTLDILMTDYGITPPKAMLGMLKTDPKVRITFETLLSVPLT